MSLVRLRTYSRHYSYTYTHGVARISLICKGCIRTQVISRPTYVFLGIATILQYLYTPSHLSTVFLEILISEDFGCRLLSSLQEDCRICRHSKLLIDAGPEVLRRGQATVFAEQAGDSRARRRLNSWSELYV